jgi:hypothetical protein
MPLSVGGAAVAEPEELLLAAGQGCGDVGEAAVAGDLDFSSWGQGSPAWSSSRRVTELRVEAGMAGMCPILPSPASCPGYEHVPANRRLGWLKQAISMRCRSS